MESYLDNLKQDELCGLYLRKLYESFGYKKVNVNKFEDFKLYANYLNFLSTDNIITFMNYDGKLLALKPDVTLSVVKNIASEDTGIFERLYYIEPVYKFSKENHEFSEINQIGLEFIGTSGIYQTLEAVNLAVLSLNEIHENFLLEISHLKFISGILDGVKNEAKPEILKFLHNKNSHDLTNFVSALDLSGEYKNNLISLGGLCGEFEKILFKAEKMIMNDEMLNAVNELKLLYKFLKETPYYRNIELDFSIINDLNYYNGLIFQGFVENAPKMVLNGGRYDNLMRKLGINKGAIGFAVSLSELTPYFKLNRVDDADVLITYSDSDFNSETDYSILLKKTEEFRKEGLRVRIERNEASKKLKYKKIYRFKNNELWEE